MARGRNREALLERGGDLLYARGYDAAGVAEITAAAG
ncbi:MAG TPA: TetR family transcriptional regulator, partial [Acidobacteria bacterium]|nr:TetR family transcriptional regulator [Acidobacteriota bacterium]